MLLSARILCNVANVNRFDYDTTARFTEGNAFDVYFQLIDASQDRGQDGFYPSGRRYAPVSGAVLRVTLGFIDDEKKLDRAATQPYSNDPSIWKLSILSTDELRGGCDFILRLTEGAVITYGSVRQALSITPTSLGF